ncbi:hypothetical protein [Gloeothece verrucosa]|uniref:Uncharacterized protein n=1 Tax=Gloeothece verrucosa (strain PCC 7822) TaxID=497965 RepID=E0U7U5_GLOV7|nr:hypothetical protein [Gloeothece verrucosa]ADN14907.1 hypothetical protein Cyan7822_2950 [Gloeothece verrucosa PCC 7822]
MFIGFVGFPPIIAPPPSAIGHIPGAPNGTVQPPNNPPPGGYKPSGGGGAWRAGANAAAVAAGSYLGWQASKWLLKKFFNQSSEITPEAQERAAIAKARAAQNQGGIQDGPREISPPEYPFRGGQSAGVAYNIEFLRNDNGATTGSPYIPGSTWVYGPVKLIAQPAGGVDPTYGRLYLGYINNRDIIYFYEKVGLGGAIQITKVTRADGLPDTGGDPEPTNPPSKYSPNQLFFPPPEGATPSVPENPPSQNKSPNPTINPSNFQNPTITPIPTITPTPTINPSKKPAKKPTEDPERKPTKNPDLPPIIPNPQPRIPTIRPSNAVAAPPAPESPTAPGRTTTRNPNPNPNPKPNPDPTPEPPIPDAQCDIMNQCSAPIKKGIEDNSKKLDGLAAGLSGLGDLGIADVLAQIEALKSLITGKFTKLFQHRIVDRALATFNFILALHNAAQLSANLSQSLGQTLDTVISIFFKDVDGNPFPVSQIIGQTFTSWIKALIGEHNYQTCATGFIKANRILTATTNLFDSVKAMQSAVQDGLETIGGWVGKLNNDLVREGILSEGVGYHDESPHFRNHLGRAQEVLESLTEATESINQLASAVVETQESVTQIKQNWETLKTEISTNENTKKTEEEQKTTESSTKADITPVDLVEGRQNNGS